MRFNDLRPVQPSVLLMSPILGFSQAGRAYSPPEKEQTAHVMEHMIFKGSHTHPDAPTFLEAVEGNGAFMNAHTFDDKMTYEITTPRLGAWTAIEAYVHAIERPLFLPEALVTEREIVREELTGYLNQDNRLLWPASRAQLGIPSSSVASSLESLERIEPEDLHEHFTRTHSLATLNATVTGSLTEADKNRFAALLHNMELPTAATQEPLAVAPTQPDGPLLLERADKSNIYFVIGATALQVPDFHDVIAQDLGVNLLYSYQHSTIQRTARERGLTYGVSGKWTVGAFGNAEFFTWGNVGVTNAVNLWQLTRTALGDMLDTVTDTQIEQAKANLIGVRQLAFEYIDSIHERAIGQMGLFGTVLPLEDSHRVLEEMTPDDFRSTMDRSLSGGIGFSAILANAATLQNKDIIAELTEAQRFLSAR